MEAKDNIKIMKGARTYLVRSFIAPILMALLFFLAAGGFDHWRAWIYYALFLILSVTISFILYRKSPELLYHRNSLKSDAKGWDKFLMPAAVLTGFHLQSIVMGLDARFQLSEIHVVFMGLGIILYILSFLLAAWAMTENQHFEANVRIQNDRNHKVISSGPYKHVRHPGYVSFILSSISIPLIVGTAFGLINAIIGCILILIRTAKEDNLLKRELAGYLDYSRKVKYKIAPGIW